MNKVIRILLLSILSSTVRSQPSLPAYADSLFSTYYWQKVTLFKLLPQHESDIVFIGNSITDGSEWTELFQNLKMKNRGISGDVSAGVIRRLPETVTLSPAKIFLMIGINDLARGVTPDSVIKNITLIAQYLHQRHPTTKLYVQSILPVNADFGKFGSHVNKTKEIEHINKELDRQAASYGYTYLNLHDQFEDGYGKLKANLTNDGLHLNGTGYLLWQTLIYPYVFGVNAKPAVIPLPQKIQWRNSYFLMADCKSITISHDSLSGEAKKLQAKLSDMGWHLPVEKSTMKPAIRLRLGEVSTPHENTEAYSLEATKNEVTITASTTHGIFNGIQTLYQLLRNKLSIPTCEIIDWPAYAWRGYMVDAGRNFMPVKLLKEQIDIMSRYKLNVFHFHFTEDIAWRLAIKRYPRLTDAATMLRNPGEFYTENDMKELIAYCKERHIMLLPEIDMPGHSAAFKRAMGFDMQSDSGLLAVKHILREFFETYDLPMIHIGADEVKIVKKDFLPEVIGLISDYNKQIVGWEPGGNFTDAVIRQLWTGDAGETTKGNKNLRIIDSRHLYINHMDPLEAVTTIFFRQIGDTTAGSDNLLGATLCLWPDRRISVPEDALRMNPAYPGIITFAERSWRGGGKPGWTSRIGSPNSETAYAFKEFETRLINHKNLYFSAEPFPYVEQSGTTWTIYGPYDNNGNTSARLLAEKGKFDTTRLTSLKQETGGTVVLRHWWYPLISGVIDTPKENSTIYATTRLWSDTDGEKDFWIGFNNISRSPATDSPPIGEWDEKNSRVWVNENLIKAPLWARGGMKGNSEVPLIDEGYEYRPPTRIHLKKGWNTVWIKAPVSHFKGRDWQNPVKWQFTFIEVPAN